MKSSLIERIKAASSTLPRKQTSICNYICEHPAEVSTMTAAEFAKHLNVGTATITRLIGTLGFTNYPDFRRTLRKEILSDAKKSYSNYWEARWELFSTKDRDGEVYKTMLLQIAELVQELDDPDFFSKLDIGVQMILSARRIGVIGLRSARPLALTFKLGLHNTMDNIVAISEDPEYAYDEVTGMGKEDLVVICATYPYVKKCGDIARLCNRCGIPFILIASGPEEEHPLAKMAQLTITAGAGEDTPSSIPSSIIIELLTKHICTQLAEKTAQTIRKLDQTLMENGLTVWEGNRGETF